jgi:hypothetical protein
MNMNSSEPLTSTPPNNHQRHGRMCCISVTDEMRLLKPSRRRSSIAMPPKKPPVMTMWKTSAIGKPHNRLFSQAVTADSFSVSNTANSRKSGDVTPDWSL